jgi:nitroreductase
MEFREVVRARRMIRTYDPDRPVPRETVQTLLDLAIRAPSAGNTQGWGFLVLDDITSRDRFWAATSSEPPDAWLARMRTAPTLVVCFSDRDAYLDRYAEPDKGWTDRSESHWPVPYWHIDTGMAAMILLLGAQDAGLASCFFGVPPERWTALREAFRVPERLSPIGVVSLGYAAPDRKSPSLKRGRRPLDEVVSYGSF